MLLYVVPDEGAVGQDGQPALAGSGQDAGDERRPYAATTDARVDLGVRQRHRAAVDVVAGEADDAVADPDFEAPLLGDVHDRGVHACLVLPSPGAVAGARRVPGTVARHVARTPHLCVTSRVWRVFPTAPDSLWSSAGRRWVVPALSPRSS